MFKFKAGFLNTIRVVLTVLLSLSLLAGCSSAKAGTAAPETTAGRILSRCSGKIN